MRIISHKDIARNELDKSYSTTNSDGTEANYTANHSEDLVINMPFRGKDDPSSNAQGWYRNSPYYFKNLSNNHPEYFSQENMERIDNSRCPYVDEQFAQHCPQYEEFKGEKLIHHHVGEDGQAVAVPSSMHKGHGEIHNVERDIGVTANAEGFSKEWQQKYDSGQNPTWEDYAEDLSKAKSTEFAEVQAPVSSSHHTSETQQENENNQAKGVSSTHLSTSGGGTSSNNNERSAEGQSSPQENNPIGQTDQSVDNNQIKAPSNMVVTEQSEGPELSNNFKPSEAQALTPASNPTGDTNQNEDNNQTTESITTPASTNTEGASNDSANPSIEEKQEKEGSKLTTGQPSSERNNTGNEKDQAGANTAAENKDRSQDDDYYYNNSYGYF
jgi:hypothetical protein